MQVSRFHVETLVRFAVVVGLIAASATYAGASSSPAPAARAPAAAALTYQGKPVGWWAGRAVQARKDANARGRTILGLQRTLEHSASVEESIELATLVYPDLTPARAWAIIRHESWMMPDPLRAYNARAVNGCHATGLYQFLDCTFRSTPFGKAGMSIYSPYAQSLAAGWMHAHGRGCEWDIRPAC